MALAEPFIVDVGQIAAKVETTEGVNAALGGVDAFLAQEITWDPGQEQNEKLTVREDISPESQVPGKRLPTISFKVCLRGSGTAGTAPDWGTLMLGCKFGETEVASTSITYDPIASGDSSLTIGFYKRRDVTTVKLILLTGCRGNVSATWVNGAIAFLDFAFTGGEYTESDTTPLTSTSFDTTTPLVFQNATFNLDSKSDFGISALDWDAGNQIAPREDVNSASGHLSAFLTKPKPVGRFDPEEETIAVYDILGKMRSGAEGALSTVLSGGAGNIATFTAPKVQYLTVVDANRNGIRTKDANLQYNRSAATGNDHFSLAFT